MPTAATAIATATSYAAANTPANLSGLTFTYTTKCTATAIIATGCVSNVNPNELVVTGTASTNTWFAKLFGISHFDVATHANACSPCSSTPVDIVIAIDRTGSMCSPTGKNGACTDLNNAKDGVQTMLGILNPPYAQVGMVAFPPVQSTATDVCSAPYNSLANGFDGYDSATRGYVTDTISGNYKTGSRDGAQRGFGSRPAHHRRRFERLHRGRRQHVVQRGAAPGPGRAARTRAGQRARTTSSS